VQVLISPVSLEEAFAVCDGGAEIVDIKNTREGSLGASFPWIIRDIVKKLQGRGVVFSATLGDLPFKPGTAALAALGAAASGAQYIKAGLHGVRNYDEAAALMSAVVRACRDFDDKITVVAAGYADYRRFDGLDTATLVQVGRNTGCDLVMVDTAIKDGATLFDALSRDEIVEFVSSAHRAGLQVALAGSVKIEHLPELHRIAPDVVGIRGAVCTGRDRNTRIDPEMVKRFVAAARAPIPA
jgi:uncharacterized protein (UPF0264 family)